MKKYDGLLQQIADELNIKQGKTEDEKSYKCRVLYSILGRMAYASLWDTREDQVPVSVVHLKQRIARLLDGYLKLYPELKYSFSSDASLLCDEIYEQYLSAGCFYHTPNRITACLPCQSDTSDVVLCRGLPLNLPVLISGIGAYRRLCSDKYPVKTLKEMFQFPSVTLTESWKHTIQNVQWREYQSGERPEYLSMKPPFRGGYWGSSPVQDGTISLMRTGIDGMRFYYLYRYEGKTLLCSQLPAWKVEKGNVRTLSNSLLSAVGTLPATTYKIDGDIVYIHLHYLLPPPELNMIKLYSWPRSFWVEAGAENNPFSGSFRRTMTKDVFFSIKRELETIGYRFIEE